MRYLICKNNVSNEEIIARMEYIYELFHIYTFKDSKNSNENTTVLNSIPRNKPDILMLVGHDLIANNYVFRNIDKIPEKNIIVISCNTQMIKKLKNTNGKNIYLPRNSKKLNYYDGMEVGFKFDITNEEMLLYRNRKEGLNKMIINVLERMETDGEDNGKN